MQINIQLKQINELIAKTGGHLNPKLSEKELIAFEQIYGITLPLEYRSFVLNIGDGGLILPEYSKNLVNRRNWLLKPLRESKLSKELLSTPFPYTESWNWEGGEGEYDIEADTEGKYHLTKCGNIELFDIGDGASWNLIVNGTCKGEVWSFSEVGIFLPSERMNFYDWIINWFENKPYW